MFQQATSLLAGRVADALYRRAFDPDNAFLWISLHHLAQMLLALLAMGLLRHALGLRFRLKPTLDASGARMVAVFVAAMLVYAVLYYLIGNRLGLLLPFGHEPSARNILGVLGFQLFLSGPAEELLFRALPMTLLAWVFRDCDKPRTALCIVVAALLFSIAHINWYTDPFRLSFHWYQLIYAFVLGIVYGIAYAKRGSVLYPMLLHSLSNVIVIGLGYAFFGWLG